MDEETLRVDLLLSDVVMPDMPGPELGARLRAMRPGLRVLYMSGYAPSLAGGVDMSLDSTHFIQKPFTMTELARSVEKIMRWTPRT
jgi:DNA-binding NtrC family response regulator